MMAPTHIAFAVVLGNFSGVSPLNLKLLAAGALLPDIDHPRSAIGRIFFLLSIPLNKYFGHRKAIHGFFLWSIVSVLGYIFWKPVFFLGMGAISHIFIDAWNVSGVQALEPFSEKICVIFSRNWRIITSSRNEFFVMAILGVMAWSSGYIGSTGGIRAMLGTLIGSYDIAHQQYLSAGTKICYIEGKLRLENGKIEKGKWLIIGKEGKSGLGILKDKKVFHIPAEGMFLRAKIKESSSEHWQAVRISNYVETKNEVFVMVKGKWRKIPAGKYVSGYIIGKKLEFDTVSLQ